MNNCAETFYGDDMHPLVEFDWRALQTLQFGDRARKDLVDGCFILAPKDIQSSYQSKGPACAHGINHGYDRCTGSSSHQASRQVIRRSRSSSLPGVDVYKQRIDRVVEADDAYAKKGAQYAWNSDMSLGVDCPSPADDRDG
ncbi:hypothetical protein HG530_006037 [Fusarium avenaceum]|nr:hypothetical protein HG530_006037 [Fusarium avenaceum]